MSGWHVFYDGEIPSPHEFILMADAKIENLTEAVRQLCEQGGDLVAAVKVLLNSNGATTYKCPECGRLLVFEEGLDKAARSYRPES